MNFTAKCDGKPSSLNQFGENPFCFSGIEHKKTVPASAGRVDEGAVAGWMNRSDACGSTYLSLTEALKASDMNTSEMRAALFKGLQACRRQSTYS